MVAGTMAFLSVAPQMLLEHEVLRYAELVRHATAELGPAADMTVK